MKILKNAGSFEVLNKEELVNPKNGVVWKIARAARTCYQSEEFASEEKDAKLVKHLLKRGHHAMIEFGGTMTVQFNNISRGFTHEMVRHRLCSFAQESTRYVDESDFKVVVPPHRDEKNDVFVVEAAGDKFYFNLTQWLMMNEGMYRALRKAGWKTEDARQVLPIGIKSQIVVGANIREWRHIFDMRCSKAAHWEIRGVVLELLKWCKDNIPLVYDDYHFDTKEGKVFATRG